MRKLVLAAALGVAVSLDTAAAADRSFDTWQTSLANEAARKQAVVPTAQVCQQATEMLKLASTFDAKAFHDYAVAHAVYNTHPKCAR